MDVEAASEIEAENDLETDTEPEGFAMAANEGPSSDDLPTVEAEVLDPAPQAEQPVAMVIESLDEVDALLADGRHG